MSPSCRPPSRRSSTITIGSLGPDPVPPSSYHRIQRYIQGYGITPPPSPFPESATTRSSRSTATFVGGFSRQLAVSEGRTGTPSNQSGDPFRRSARSLPGIVRGPSIRRLHRRTSHRHGNTSSNGSLHVFRWVRPRPSESRSHHSRFSSIIPLPSTVISSSQNRNVIRQSRDCSSRFEGSNS